MSCDSGPRLANLSEHSYSGDLLRKLIIYRTTRCMFRPFRSIKDIAYSHPRSSDSTVLLVSLVISRSCYR
jgi:hypothetical protein